MNRREEIRSRLEEIGRLVEQPDANLDALETECRSLKEELATIEAEAERRAKIREAVNQGAGTVTRTFGSKPDKEFDLDSEEYRTTWLKRMQGKELTEVEKRAYTAANGAISHLVANDILTVARDHAPLLQDLTVLYSESKIDYYVENDNEEAQDHTENAEITPSSDTTEKVSLNPSEITKLIQVSEAAKKMSIPAFNTWITTMLGKAVARKINAKIITAINGSATSAGTAITEETVRELLGSVSGDVIRIVCNRKTLFTKLLPLQDNSKSKIISFEGGGATVYGVPVQVDAHVSDDTVLAGDMSKAVAAMGEDITVRNAYDIDTNSYKYIGVALFDVKVGIASAFAKLAAAG